MPDSQFHVQAGTLLEAVARRPGAVEWRVRLADGTEARAIAYTVFGDGSPGESVWLNTTAVELSLGTGGLHFVLAPQAVESSELRVERPERASPSSPELSTLNSQLSTDWGAAPQRDRGHLMKLRYTPLQHAVLAVEEEVSPQRAAVEAVQDLKRLPVVVAELHSAAMAAAVAARACGARRLVYVMADAAALPLPVSRIAARLRSDGVLAGTITAGQAFGGDLEAVTVASALAAARAVFDADHIVVAQGPGNAGTGTRLGFSGLAQAEHLNAAAALGGRPVAALRISFADPRDRHRGLSHHTATVLGRMTLARVSVAVPELPGPRGAELRTAIEAAGLPERHEVRRVLADDLIETLRCYSDALTTMGRTIDEDREFFLAACAAARLAVEPASGTAWTDRAK